MTCIQLCGRGDPSPPLFEGIQTSDGSGNSHVIWRLAAPRRKAGSLESNTSSDMVADRSFRLVIRSIVILQRKVLRCRSCSRSAKYSSFTERIYN